MGGDNPHVIIWEDDPPTPKFPPVLWWQQFLLTFLRTNMQIHV